MTYPHARRASPRTTMIRLFGVIAVALGLQLSLPGPATAQAQTVCLPHAEVIKQLGEKFSEAPIGIGLASNGGLIELFSSSDGDTWTMVMTMPGGATCVLAAGEAWEHFPKVALGPQA